MAAPITHDFGFDINVARANLVDWLVQDGVVSAEQIDEWGKQWRVPVDVAASRTALEERGESQERIEQLTSHWQATINARAEASDEDVAWAITMNIAQVHAEVHGPPVIVRRVPQARSSRVPCKRAAVSLALIQLLEARREVDAPEVALGERLAQRGKAWRAAAALGKNLEIEEAVRRQQKRYDDMLNHCYVDLPQESPQLHCNDAPSQVEQLAQADENQALAIRRRLLSPELRSRKPDTPEVGDSVGLDISGKPELQGHEPSARGAKKRALLAAMWQQLSWWGFSRREASELVPDDNLNRDRDACIDRVRKGIADRDWRTIRPWSPDQLDGDTSS